MGLKRWYKNQDEQEKSAIVAFGIGMPLVIIIFGAILLWLR